ncbi:hypothetical protein K227x_47970 [Rubripirellula lacrimiformis]|uniref:Uncharacterized protein n=1 Tax=Rubripirellula lacrimiformis TaxID=1930273 RepID=A0A517NH30_9BACT|nr:hypothetical protein K227x_47970 [Rubripirellula lacrimiformis]
MPIPIWCAGIGCRWQNRGRPSLERHDQLIVFVQFLSCSKLHQRCLVFGRFRIAGTASATAGTAAAKPAGHRQPDLAQQPSGCHGNDEANNDRLNVHGTVVGNLMTASRRHPQTSKQPGPDLVGDQCTHIGQHRHVSETEDRPEPRIRFAANHQQRADALGTQGKEHHHRQRDRDRIDR